MSKQTFITICIGWGIAVILMCVWLYLRAKQQDRLEDEAEAIQKENDWDRAILDDIAYDFRKKYTRDQVRAALEGTRSARLDWQENARRAEALGFMDDEPPRVA